MPTKYAIFVQLEYDMFSKSTFGRHMYPKNKPTYAFDYVILFIILQLATKLGSHLRHCCRAPRLLGPSHAADLEAAPAAARCLQGGREQDLLPLASTPGKRDQ